MQVFKNGSEFILVTDKSPGQFQDVLFLSLRGTSPETLEECIVAPGQTRDWQKVDLASLNSKWRRAFGLTVEESKPEAEASRGKPGKTRRKRRPRRDQEAHHRQDEPDEDYHSVLAFYLDYIENNPSRVLLLMVCGIGFLYGAMFLIYLIYDTIWNLLAKLLTKKAPSA